MPASSSYQGKSRSPRKPPENCTSKIGLSLKDIRRNRPAKTMRTLKAWCNLGDWDGLREERSKDRTRSVRSACGSSMLDRAEAQIKEDKLPHIEIGLMYKLERIDSSSESRRSRRLCPRQSR